MSAHTLGPWVAVANRVYATAASGHNTMTTIEVAVATRADPRARAKVEQNARLIAAAPELLDALKSCEYEISACLREASVKANSEVLSALQTAYDEARKAIAKAGAA